MPTLQRIGQELLPMKVHRPRVFTIVAATSAIFCLVICALRGWYGTTVATPSTASVQAALGKRLPMVNFTNVALSDAIEFLGDIGGVPIQVDWKALEAAGVNRDQLIAMTVNNLTLGETLASILSSAGPEAQFMANGANVRVSAKGVTWRDLSSELAEKLSHDPIRLYELQRRGNPPPPPPPLWEKVVGARRYTLVMDRGALRLWSTPPDPALIYQQSAPIGKESSPTGIKVFEFANISIRRSGSPFHTWTIALPFWLLILITVICPALWIVKAVRSRRRLRLHRCTHCGYDLRATPELCPECGLTPSHLTPIKTSIVN